MTTPVLRHEFIGRLLSSGANDVSAAQAIMSEIYSRTGSNTVHYSDLTELYKSLTTTVNTGAICEDSIPALPAYTSACREPVVGVIVEARAHPGLEFVVGQFSSMLGIPIQLFHSTSNENFILESSIMGLVDEGRVQMVNLGIPVLDRRQYNSLLLRRDFWESLAGRGKVLIFQTDAILCRNSPYKLRHFINYDYIGSKWPRSRPIGLVIDGGNGGLSLRDWAKSVQCIQEFPPLAWRGGEDGYFAFHMDLLQGTIGDARACARFSSQYEFNHGCFGAHKISDMEAACREKFMAYCPEARDASWL